MSSPKNLSVADAAAYYGVNPRTVRRMIADGKLRAYRVAGTIRISADDLEKAARPIPTGGAAA